jgi:hypothetical protein
MLMFNAHFYRFHSSFILERTGRQQSGQAVFSLLFITTAISRHLFNFHAAELAIFAQFYFF